MVSHANEESVTKDLSNDSAEESATGGAASEGETEAEMRLYLDKLKEIVPRCPKHRKVSRLELIQHVIDYICDLQQALEDRVGLRGADLNFLAQQEISSAEVLNKSLSQRQPLGVLPLPENIPLGRARRESNRTTAGAIYPSISAFLSGAENG